MTDRRYEAYDRCRRQLENLVNAMVDDIMALSDDEVMAERREDLGSQEAVDKAVMEMQGLVETCIRNATAKREANDGPAE